MNTLVNWVVLGRNLQKKLSNSLLHGENGQGRFKVYALGEQVRWETIYNDGNTNLEYTIKGDINQIAQVLPSEPEITDKQVGTSVYIDNLIEKLTLPQKDTQENLLEFFVFIYQNIQIKNYS